MPNVVENRDYDFTVPGTNQNTDHNRPHPQSTNQMAPLANPAKNFQHNSFSVPISPLPVPHVPIPQHMPMSQDLLSEHQMHPVPNSPIPSVQSHMHPAENLHQNDNMNYYHQLQSPMTPNQSYPGTPMSHQMDDSSQISQQSSYPNTPRNSIQEDENDFLSIVNFIHNL